MVNEFMIVIVTDTLVIFTDFCLDLELKYNVGWAYVGVIVLCIFYNGYFIVCCICKALYILYRKLTR